MLDFVLELESLLKRWPDNSKMNIVQIGEKTKTATPHVMEYLSDALNKTLDIHDPMSYNEVSKAFAILYDKSQEDIQRKQEQIRQLSEKALKSYDATLEKVKIMQCSKNWRGAYRTLAYFFGLNREYLPNDVIVSICDECLRIGIKAAINFQELSQWLRQSIITLLDEANEPSIESALDVIDAYGEFFMTQPNNRGENYLTSLIMELKPAVMEFNLNDRLNALAKDLNITSVMDIVI